MADAKETLFAQTTLLNYLHGSKSARTVKEILAHLQQHADWGRSKLEKTLPDGGLRNVQSWLKYLCESSDFDRQITWEPDSVNREQF